MGCHSPSWHQTRYVADDLELLIHTQLSHYTVIHAYCPSTEGVEEAGEPL